MLVKGATACELKKRHQSDVGQYNTVWNAKNVILPGCFYISFTDANDTTPRA